MLSSQEIDTHIEGSSLAIRPPVLPEVSDVVNNVRLDLDKVAAYRTNIVEWLSPITDLSGFHVYPTNGITEGLNYWMALDERTILTKSGDYQWVAPREGNPYQITYMSNPDAATGNWRDVPKNGKIALDMAYVGSTAPHSFDMPDNVDFAFFSLSKPFGLRNLRTGWMFSRQPIKHLDLLIGSGKYYNQYAHDVAEAVIGAFSPFHVYDRYAKSQAELSSIMDFTPSDSVWLATTHGDKYQRFKRNFVDARINLSGLLS